MQMRSDAAKFEINLLAIFILTCISAFSCSQPGFPSTGLAQGKVFAHTGFHLHPPIPVQQYWSKTTLGKILQTHPVLKSRFSQVEFEQLPRPERNHRNENIVQQIRSPSNRRSRRPTRGLTPPEHREMKAARTQGLQCTEVNISIQLESNDSKWFFFLRAEIFNLECFVQKYSYYGVLWKNIGQVSLHVTWKWGKSINYMQI